MAISLQIIYCTSAKLVHFLWSAVAARRRMSLFCDCRAACKGHAAMAVLDIVGVLVPAVS
eukprot:363897-Chlamydomonas_euryale.AAC.22